jgi:hypothetical protein
MHGSGSISSPNRCADIAPVLREWGTQADKAHFGLYRLTNIEDRIKAAAQIQWRRAASPSERTPLRPVPSGRQALSDAGFGPRRHSQSVQCGANLRCTQEAALAA